MEVRAPTSSEVERVEARIDAAEAQLAGMRDVRRSVLRRAVPLVGVVGIVAFGAMGWSLTDPLPAVLAIALAALLALLGLGAHAGVRRGERRLAELDEELAMGVRRARNDPRASDPELDIDDRT